MSNESTAMPTVAQLTPPPRVLLGPGPSQVDDRVTRAMGAPLVGHLDPVFVRAMDEVQSMLREVFETQNRLTIPISGISVIQRQARIVIRDERYAREALDLAFHGTLRPDQKAAAEIVKR